MSDNHLDPQEQAVMRETLEDQAKLLGISFHPSISDDKLLERVKAAKEGVPAENNTQDITEAKSIKEVKLIPQDQMKFSKELLKQEQRAKCLQMQRVVVVCNDPAKREWQGEILEVGNNLVGEIRKFVPFGTAWYIPNMLINMIQEKKYQRFYTRKDKYGNTTRYGKNEPAYSVSFIGNLDEVELAELAKNQMARGEAN